MAKRKFDEAICDDMQIIKQPKLTHNILSEDGALKFNFMTSLENMAMTKIASNLWMNRNTLQDIINLIHSLTGPNCGDDAFKTWQQIESNIVDKVSKLHLANSIAEKLTNIVPHLGNAIIHWMTYHAEHVFNNTYYTVDQINNVKWTTRGKINYTETAKSILSDPDCCLNKDLKYKLACTFCLKNEIANIAPVVLDQYYLDGVNIDVYPMVYFWTAYITRDNTKLNNPSYSISNFANNASNQSINEILFRMVAKRDSRNERNVKEVPIKYMWNKLSEEEKAKNLIFLFRELGSEDFRYSLLSSLSYEEQLKVFKECSSHILDDIFHDWLWEDYFLPTALHFLDVMRPESFLHILEIVIVKLKKQTQDGYVHNQYKPVFKQLWEQSSQNLKDFVLQHKNGRSLEKLVITSLSWKRDMDMIELIFKDLSAEQKKYIIFGKYGINHCAKIIKSDQWNLLELFIRYTLSTEDDVRQLKQALIEYKGLEIGVHFLEKEAFDKIEYFMNWVFQSEEEVYKFKRTLALGQICRNELNSIALNNKADFTELNKHFEWCASNNPEIVNDFKSKILQTYLFQIFKLTEEDKYETLDEVLLWCFCDNYEHACHFKRTFYHDKRALAADIVFNLIKQDDQLESLEKFVHWCFVKEEEVDQFKEFILPPCQTPDAGVCIELLYKSMFELADEFVEWCCNSSQVQIDKYKNDLMTFVEIDYIFEGAESKTVEEYIKWFNSSPETIIKFREIFEEDWWFPEVWPALEKYVQSRKFEAIKVDVDNILQNLLIRVEKGKK